MYITYIYIYINIVGFYFDGNVLYIHNHTYTYIQSLLY